MWSPPESCDDFLELVGEDTGGDVKWCRKCGAIFDSRDKTEGPASAVSTETLYCPKQGYVP